MPNDQSQTTKPTQETLKPLIKSLNLFPVVGIGASAGGLNAFKKLLKAITEDSGMAYVLVQHLDPNHESLLPEILQKVTRIPVLEIKDDIKVQPNHIYVIPSNKMMVATDGVLLLAARPAKSKTGRNLPIDLFFTSLAEVHQEQAIGVVLSGTASDGTLGLKAIKEHGGITFAQDEASAEYDGMPNSAAQAGVVDFILPPEEIPKKLLEVTSKAILNDEELKNIPQQNEDVFKQILSLLRIRKGVDFTYYKQTTIRRRILRRMVVNKDEEPADYLKFLRGNTSEQDLLYQDMLIPVTSFFRDKKIFDNLCNNLFPTILKNKIPGEITRIWVAGCSTGQEVYSFAICFKEFLGNDYEKIQIFGTDLSEPAITKARAGIYEKSEVDEVLPQRLKEYFTKNNGGYQVNKSIRDMCVFAHHNFLKDPPFGKMDCISCRNVLIYMEPYLQKKALTTFHYALNPKGFLLLGKSETTGGVPDLFAAEGKGDKLYTRKDVPGRFMQVASQRSEQILNLPPDSVKSEAIRTDFQKTADDILLTKYTPAGVVVNETMDIVHFRGNTSTYLEQAPGKPSHNLLMMAKNGLGFELRNILHKAKIEKVPVIKENIPLSVNGHLLNISIEAVPLPNTMEPYYLILFHDNNLNDTDSSVKTNRKKVSAKTKKEEKDIQIQLLEQELAQAREDMRSITEDQEASNEELQSANEELLSGSEELQSLNEELETSKEELQSTNEELSVLNHELISLNEQVTDARNYSESIVATLYQPLLVLDKNLRVKSANQAFYKIFKVDEQETEGVLIYDLGNRQWNIPELRTLLEEILPQKKHITDFEVTHNFLSIGERVILLSALELTREKKEEKLILLSIEDITERKEAAKKIEENEKHLQNIFLNAPTALCILEGTEQKVILANKAYEKLINRKAADLLGKSNREVFPELIGTGTFELFDKVFETGEPFSAPEYAAMVDLNNEGAPRQCYFNFSVDPLKNDSGKIYAVMAMAYDITPQVETRKKIEENEHRYHMMLMNSPFAFSIMKGKNMVVTLANDLMKDFWGKGQQVEGKPVFEVLPELIDQPFPALLDKVYSSGEPLNANEILARLNRNGIMEDRYFNIVFQPHFEADKTISGVICVAHEVTSQVLARKQIEDSNKRYNMLLMQSPFAFAVLKGKDMVVTLANDSVKEMWGKGKEVEGKPFIEVLPELKNQRFPVLLNEVYTTGIPYSSYESLVVLQRNGIMGDTYFNFTYQPYREADETISGVVIIATEVTPQAILNIKIKESEEKFSTLADNMENLAWIADGGGSVYWYNKRWFEYTGTTLEEMAGWGWQKVHHPDHVDDVVAFAKKAWYINEPFELTFPLRRHDGEYRWFLTSARPIADADGKVIRWLGTNTDITAQIEATKKIEESEAFNRSILENSPDCVKLVDRDGHIQFMNTNGLCLLEIDDFKSIKNKPWTELWGSDTKPVVLDAIDKALHGKTVQFQALGHTVKGTPKWWDVMVSPFVQPGTDLVSSIISVSRDITSQKEFQSLLEYRKALLEAHNEASVDGLLLVDSLGKIISYNQRFTEIWNMPKSLVAENNDEKTLAFAIAQLVHPEQFMEKMNHLYANPDVISIDELEYLDGKIVERNGYPIVAPDGSYYAWSWTFRDITEARKAEIAVGLSELNFRQLAELMPEKISHADAEGNFIYLNQNWLDYTGLSFEELENWGGEKTIHLNDLEEVTSRWQHSIKTGDNFEMEMRIRDTNGDYIWHLSRSVGVRDDMGNIKKWIGTTTQIQKLKEDEQRKSDFLKMVSHELKTPVTSIKGYVQFLSKMLNKEQEELLQPLPLRTSLTRIDSQLGRLTRLITELLDLSRIEESKIVLEKQPFKLNDLVLEAIEDIRFSSPRHEIIVLGKQRFSILGDRDRIGQVIINFITNAIKYSPHNDTIEVRINKVDNNRVSVSVKDQGIGIDKKDQEKIFDRFYRVEGKNEQRYGGFGIGLYIAAEIVKRHEGSIKVESGLGKGSIFTLTLPYISK